MKKVSILNIISIISLFFLLFPSSSIANEVSFLTKKEKEYLKNIPTINIYVEPDIYFYSYSYGKFSNGYALEYLKLLSKKIDKKINLISNIPKSEVKKRFETGNIDLAILPSLLKSNENNIIYNKTAIGILTPAILMSKIYQLPINLNSVEKLSVALVKNERFEKVFEKKYPDFDLIKVKSVQEAIEKVKAQEVDIAIGFDEIFSAYIEKKEFNQLQSIPFNDNTVFSTFKFYLSSSSKNSYLMKIFDKAIKHLDYEEIYFLRDKFFPGNVLKQTNILVDLDAKQKQFLMEKQLLNVCTVPNNMPYSSVSQNQFLGIASSFVKLLQESLDISIQIIPTSSKQESLDRLVSKRCDFLAIESSSFNPRNKLAYTSSLFEVPLVVITTDDYLYFDDFKNISNRTFLIKKAHPMLQVLKDRYPFLKLVQVDSELEALILLEKGDYFGLITTRYAVSSLFRSHIADTLKISSQIPIKMDFAFATLKSNKELLNILEITKESFFKSKVQEIIDVFVTEKYPRGFDYTIILQVVVVFLIFAAIILRQHFKVSLQNFRLYETQKKLAVLNAELENRVEEGIEKSRQKDILLYRQSKYASMGEMIGNIAHQWRQPLMELSSLLMQLQASAHFKKRVTNEEVIDTVEKSDEVINFMSHTIDDFRNFFSSKKEYEEFSINETIKESLNIMKSSFQHHKIEIDIISNSEVKAYGYKNEYAQVIINILSNAKDVLVSRKIQKAKIIILIHENDGFSKVSIKDNAGGINIEHLGKIFDPFFTKEKKGGTGIGLFMSRMIIESHMKGIITASNTMDGAIFLISVPQK